MRDWLLSFFSRLGFAWARRRLDDDARREFETHIELLVERYVRSGLTPDDAYITARRRFGNVTRAREDVYELNGFAWIDGAMQDLQYAFRQLRHSRGLSLVVIATLALGIGGTTAVFSVVQAVLLAPLPYEAPGQLVRLYQEVPGDPSSRTYLTATHFKALREEASSFEDVAALDNYSERGLDLVKDGQAQRLRLLQVSSGYFRTLRSNGLRGREFEVGDEDRVRRVVLSEALWRARFHGDPAVIGATIQLNAEPYEVVGVAPPDFADPIVDGVDVWTPYAITRDTSPENYSLEGVGRLRTGVTLEQARAELRTISESMAKRWPSARASAIAAYPLQDDLVARSRSPLQLLLIAVAIVLLVACVNVANLLLVRATGRVPEFAIRAALGSGQSRLVRQLLIESLVLAGLGGVFGIALARGGIRVLQELGRDAIPRLDAVGFDPTVLAFSALLTLVTSVAFGVAPALRAARTDPGGALRQQSRSSTGGRGLGRIRSALATTQLALALTLLAGATVLIVSFYQLQQVELGVRVDNVLTFEVNLPTARYDTERRAAFHEQLARRLETIPGVSAAGATSRLPATGSFHPWTTQIETGPLAGTGTVPRRGLRNQQRTVSGEYFRALDIPVLAGRTFDDRDDSRAPGRAVVTASFAQHAFPGVPLDHVVGQRIRVLGNANRREIIGVVGDIAYDVFGQPAMVVFHAHRQFAGNRNWALTQVVAASLPPAQILSAVRTEVAALDPELVVHRAAPMSEVIGRGVSRERFALVLMGAFAFVALMLAVIGLYGVLAYSVRQRSQEIGIRMALGASAGQVRAGVLRQAATVLAIGVAIGVAGALVLGRWLSSLVFEISPSDPRILLATAVVLTITGLIAAWLPARRASRVEPRLAMQEGAH